MRQIGLRNEYPVEKILQMKLVNGLEEEQQYLVKWEGYPCSRNSWEPVKHFGDCFDQINEYREWLRAERKKGNKNYKWTVGNDVYYLLYPYQEVYKEKEKEKEREKLSNIEQLFEDSDEDSIQKKLVEQMELVEKLKKQQQLKKEQKEREEKEKREKEKLEKEKQERERKEQEEREEEEREKELEKQREQEKLKENGKISIQALEQQTAKQTEVLQAHSNAMKELWGAFTQQQKQTIEHQKKYFDNLLKQQSQNHTEYIDILTKKVKQIEDKLQQQKEDKQQQQEQEEEVEKGLSGSFRYKDIAQKILSCQRENGQLLYQVWWDSRHDGTQPQPSEVTNQELKKYQPALLFNYYESKLQIKHKPKIDRNTQIETYKKVESPELRKTEELHYAQDQLYQNHQNNQQVPEQIESKEYGKDQNNHLTE